ncbi:sigma 54-interacting transcriptional regulator, partial [bacterium]|nr:sigma 54-interacting transcriptional regulator [candidate division CSSED10-310 bacterium]
AVPPSEPSPVPRHQAIDGDLRALLEAVAVAGGVFHIACLGDDTGHVRQRLAPLVDEGWLVSERNDGWYRFTDPGNRLVFYNAIPEDRRRCLHEQLWNTMKDGRQSMEALIHGVRAGRIGESGGWLERFGVELMAAGDFSAAATVLGSCGGQPAAPHLAAADALFLQGRYEEALAMYSTSLAYLTDAQESLRWTIKMRMADGLLHAGDSDGAKRLVEDFKQTGARSGSKPRGFYHLVSARLASAFGTVGEAIKLGRRAIRILAGEDGCLPFVLLGRLLVLRMALAADNRPVIDEQFRALNRAVEKWNVEWSRRLVLVAEVECGSACPAEIEAQDDRSQAIGDAGGDPDSPAVRLAMACRNLFADEFNAAERLAGVIESDCLSGDEKMVHACIVETVAAFHDGLSSVPSADELDRVPVSLLDLYCTRFDWAELSERDVDGLLAAALHRARQAGNRQAAGRIVGIMLHRALLLGHEDDARKLLAELMDGPLPMCARRRIDACETVLSNSSEAMISFDLSGGGVVEFRRLLGWTALLLSRWREFAPAEPGDVSGENVTGPESAAVAHRLRDDVLQCVQVSRRRSWGCLALRAETLLRCLDEVLVGLQDRLVRQQEELRVLRETGICLGSEGRGVAFMRRVAAGMRAIFDARGVLLCISDPHVREASLLAVSGELREAPQPFARALLATLAELEECPPLLSAEQLGAVLSEQPAGRNGWRVCIPFGGAEVTGCLYLEGDRGDSPDKRHEPRLFQALSSHLAGALDLNCMRELVAAVAPDETPVAGIGDSLGIVGEHQRIKALRAAIRTAARVNSTVLILGESGTGKELVARGIHRAGPRASGRFIPCFCGAVPDTLWESELFGHVRGSFTGATASRPGLLAEAEGGILFLDEIADVPLSMQAKLLRVLQEREIRQVGSNRVRTVDVRFIAATNKNLRKEIREGRFREDLFYRLSVISIHVPPLRRRRQDIKLLALHFLGKYNRTFSRNIRGFHPETLRMLCRWHWPGNVRELQNDIEAAVAMAPDGVLLHPEHLKDKRLRYTMGQDAPAAAGVAEEMQRRLVEVALDETAGNRTEAAKVLGISRQAFYNRLRKFGLA